MFGFLIAVSHVAVPPEQLHYPLLILSPTHTLRRILKVLLPGRLIAGWPSLKLIINAPIAPIVKWVNRQLIAQRIVPNIPLGELQY